MSSTKRRTDRLRSRRSCRRSFSTCSEWPRCFSLNSASKASARAFASLSNSAEAVTSSGPASGPVCKAQQAVTAERFPPRGAGNARANISSPCLCLEGRRPEMRSVHGEIAESPSAGAEPGMRKSSASSSTSTASSNDMQPARRPCACGGSACAHTGTQVCAGLGALEQEVPQLWPARPLRSSASARTSARKDVRLSSRR